jgi:hypothetical protein
VRDKAWTSLARTGMNDIGGLTRRRGGGTGGSPGLLEAKR